MRDHDGALQAHRRLRALFTFLLPGLLACGPQTGARSLALVRKDSAALRSRTLLDLERSLVFPQCAERPSAAYECGLLASRAAEGDIAKRCADAACAHQKVEALYATVRQRAEALGVDLRSVTLRCGPPCRDLRALELEVLKLSADGAEQRARQAYLRADSTEREALEREREDLPPFVAKKKERDEKLEALLVRYRRAMLQAGREEASLSHTTLCASSEECVPESECVHFREAAVGSCQKP